MPPTLDVIHDCIPPMPVFYIAGTAEANMNFDDLERQYRTMYEHPRFCIVFDTRELSYLQAFPYLSRGISMLTSLRAQTAEQVAASVIIISNPLIRGMIDLVSTWYPPVSLQKIVATPQEAWEILEKRKKKLLRL
jgi:hypothetical protein